MGNMTIEDYIKEANKAKTNYGLCLILEAAADDDSLSIDEFTMLNDYIDEKMSRKKPWKVRKVMRKVLLMMIMVFVMIIVFMTTSTVYAKEYLDGEELFYNDVYNHENVDLVYDADYVKAYREAQKKPTNKRLVKQYCREHFGNIPIKYVKNPSYKKITHRKGKGYILVEVIKSKSRGRYGVMKNGCRIKYNKKVKKGKKVTSYCIYSPYNNYCDDVVAVVDNKKIR